ncbi:hypothetical protein NL676_016276 [Syzygium grande]|nr:hypothetical protein NL676_016276 [Syzygium grande]
MFEGKSETDRLAEERIAAMGGESRRAGRWKKLRELLGGRWIGGYGSVESVGGGGRESIAFIAADWAIPFAGSCDFC